MNNKVLTVAIFSVAVVLVLGVVILGNNVTGYATAYTEVTTTFPVYYWDYFSGWGNCVNQGGGWSAVNDFCKANGYSGAVPESEGPCYHEQSTARYNWNGALSGKNMVQGGSAGGGGYALTKVKCAGSTQPVCGNDKVEGTEKCDDGNVNDNDGCSRICTYENCEDSDGKDYSVKGTVTLSTVMQYTDTCEGSLTKVREYSCIDNARTAQSDYIPCPSGQKCDDGRCVTSTSPPSQCVDSDGYDYNEMGTTTDKSGLHSDSCLVNGKIREYYCLPGSDYANYDEIPCPSGQKCDDGKCIIGTTIQQSTNGIYYCWGASSTDFTITTSATKPYSWYRATSWSPYCFTSANTCNNYCKGKGYIFGFVGIDSQQCVCGDSVSQQVCGNKIREGTEVCDDGNFVDWDGCSSTCTADPVLYCCGISSTDFIITVDRNCEYVGSYSRQTWSGGCLSQITLTCNKACIDKGYISGMIDTSYPKNCRCDRGTTQLPLARGVSIKKAPSSPASYYSDPTSINYTMNEMLLLNLTSVEKDTQLNNITLQASGSGNDLEIKDVRIYSTSLMGKVTNTTKLVGNNSAGYSDDRLMTISLSNYNLSIEPSYLLFAYIVGNNVSEGDTFYFTVKDAQASKDNSPVKINGLPIISATDKIRFVVITPPTGNNPPINNITSYYTECSPSEKPTATDWSTCLNNQQTKTNYLCDTSTGEWYASTSSQSCGVVDEGLSGGTIIIIILSTLLILSGGLFALWYFYLGPKDKFLGDLYQSWFGSTPKDDELEAYLSSKK